MHKVTKIHFLSLSFFPSTCYAPLLPTLSPSMPYGFCRQHLPTWYPYSPYHRVTFCLHWSTSGKQGVEHYQPISASIVAFSLLSSPLDLWSLVPIEQGIQHWHLGHSHFCFLDHLPHISLVADNVLYPSWLQQLPSHELRSRHSWTYHWMSNDLHLWQQTADHVFLLLPISQAILGMLFSYYFWFSHCEHGGLQKHHMKEALSGHDEVSS